MNISFELRILVSKWLALQCTTWQIGVWRIAGIMFSWASCNCPLSSVSIGNVSCYRETDRNTGLTMLRHNMLISYMTFFFFSNIGVSITLFQCDTQNAQKTTEIETETLSFLVYYVQIWWDHGGQRWHHGCPWRPGYWDPHRKGLPRPEDDDRSLQPSWQANHMRHPGHNDQMYLFGLYHLFVAWNPLSFWAM